jgi:hypothetical protein
MEMRTCVMNGADHFGIWIEMPLLDFLSECRSLLANFVLHLSLNTTLASLNVACSNFDHSTWHLNL